MSYPIFSAISTGLTGIKTALGNLTAIKTSLDNITALAGPTGATGANGVDGVDGVDGAGVWSAWTTLGVGGSGWVASNLKYRTTGQALHLWGTLSFTGTVTPSTNDTMVYSFPVGNETLEIRLSVPMTSNGIYNTKTVEIVNSLGRLTYKGDGTINNPVFWFNHMVPF